MSVSEAPNEVMGTPGPNEVRKTPDPTFSAEVNYSAEDDSATDGGLGQMLPRKAKLLERQDVGKRPKINS